MNKPLNKDEVAKKYDELKPQYLNLATALKQAMQSFLEKAGIDVLDVAFRLKEFDSFWDKIERKGYKRPFSQVEDLCGIRIVCFYPSDLERISEIINTEFIVRESEDKADLLEPDRFGYRSLHYVVVLKKTWLNAPQYRGLGNLKVEIQVRTILMHAWADLSHKLSYKKKEDVPDQFKRRIYQLSALFEIADQQFDNLRSEKLKFQKRLSKRSSAKSRFDTSQPLNVDTLQAFLDFYFPKRDRSSAYSISYLVSELEKYKVSFEQLVDAYERTKQFLPVMEREEFKGEDYASGWAQEGVVRAMLTLTNDGYWKQRQRTLPRPVAALDKRFRVAFKEQEKSKSTG